MTRSTRLSKRPARALLLALALLAAACGQAPSALESARDAADEGDRTRAIGLYQQYLESSPEDFDARLEYTLLLGEEWAYRGGDRAPIVENLERLYAAQPDNLRVKELLAMMLVREGQASAEARRFEDAERLYRRAIDVHPDVGTSHYHLGVLYADQNRSEDAFEAYVAAAIKRPPIPDLYLRLGLAYLDRGDLDRAINTLELVEELRGTSTYLLPRMHCGLARAYVARGEPEVAQEHLRRAHDDCSVPGLGAP